MMPPEFLISGMAKKTATASLILNHGIANAGLLLTSKIKGIDGNRITVKIEVSPSMIGPPTCAADGFDISYSLPGTPAYEASGSFFYNGLSVNQFQTCWYVGELNGKPSYSLDGQPVTWPLSRDGEFMVHDGTSWNQVFRSGGVNVMHWKADSQASDVYQIPRAAASVETPDGWYGAAPLCTGWIDAHFTVPLLEALNLPMITEGLPEIYIIGNARANALINISVVDGQTGTGLLVTTKRQRLDGGA